MSAFGKRNGVSGGGQRPAFGVARPMKSGPGAAPAAPGGGEQFPPIEELQPEIEVGVGDVPTTGAMDRLNSRQNASGDQANSKTEGFVAALHRIKEQVLQRLL